MKTATLAAAIIVACTINVEAKYSFNGLGEYVFSAHKQKRAFRTLPKLAKIVTHKEKTVSAAIPLPRPKPLIPDALKPSSLVETAKKYLGTNPTGWNSVWCGRFMAMIAPQAAKRIGNPNLAINWTRLPKVAPKVGAILITRRSGGNHVGVVIGFKDGDPITISGNHGNKVGIGRYPRSRIVAYVSA